ncbi:MAG: 50S ribosomal protein L18 [Planctomycetaceae bacterium]
MAAVVGRLIGERAKGEGISEVVFDRGAFSHHGRRGVTDAAREQGLQF